MKKSGIAKLLLLGMTLLLVLTVAFGCAPVHTNYAESEHWIVRQEHAEKAVDVFYVCPTSWAKVGKEEPNICEIDNETLLIGGKRSYDRQATAFETVGNMFAPYYRQADAEYCLSLSFEDQEKFLAGAPKQDVFDAFDYYFEHYNEGRPFILAGHSQGSDILLTVLSEYMTEHLDRYDRMVAAYVIGYSVTDEYLANNPHLKFAEGAGDTGVIVSYNTEAPGVTADNPVLLPGARVINPITWTTGAEPAGADQNLGSRIDRRDVPHFADATVDLARGVLICATADANDFYSRGSIFAKGVYHVQDYPFYYYDLRANAELRAENYLAENNA